jgi:hypothetical protein
MGWKLNTYVHVAEVDSAGKPTGRAATFGPADDMSAEENAWAVARIGNPDVWESEGSRASLPSPPEARIKDGEKPTSALLAEVTALRARVAELEAGRSTPAAGSSDVPPRSGPGSGAMEWRAYAGKVGVDVADDASREDVLAALDASGKPTTR